MADEQNDARSKEEPQDMSPEDMGRAEDMAEGALPVEGGSASLEAEVERLRAENAALAEKAEKPTHPGRGRTAASVILIVLGALIAAIAVPAFWLNRTIMNTDQWVATMAPLAKDPNIQDAVSARASAAIIDRLNAEQIAKDALPPKAQVLATPIANAVNSFIKQQTTNIVQSDQFATIWAEANRIAHDAIIRLVTERQGPVVTSANGQITVDLTALLEKIQQGLVDRGLDIVGKIPVSSLPNKEITIVDSPALASVQGALKLMNQTAFILPLLALVLLGGAVGTAVRRRTAVMWVGIALIIAMLLPIEAIYLAKYPYTNALHGLGVVNIPAAQAVYDTVFKHLIMIERNVLILGLILWAGAIVAGPSRWAVALRGGVQHGMRGIGTTWDFGAFGEWVLAHKQGLRSIGLIAGVLLLLFWRISPGARIIWVGILVIVWLLAVELFGRPRPVAEEQPQLPGMPPGGESPGGEPPAAA